MTSRSTAWLGTLALTAAMLVGSEADAQWGRGWGRGPGWWGPPWAEGYPTAGYGYRNRGYGGGWGMWGPQGRCLFGPRMTYWLGVTQAQQERIDDLYFKALDTARPLLRDLDRTESELAALAAAQKPDEKAAEGLRKKARDLDGKIEGVWSKYEEQVLALLTPEQRQEYDRLAATRGPSYLGPGYGPGYGYGMGRYMRWGRGGGLGGGRGWGWRGGGWGW
jgi:Spy/CpxP family protein refolding chaperone